MSDQQNSGHKPARDEAPTQAQEHHNADAVQGTPADPGSAPAESDTRNGAESSTKPPEPQSSSGSSAAPNEDRKAPRTDGEEGLETDASVDDARAANESEPQKGDEGVEKATGKNETKPSGPSTRRSGGGLDFEKTFCHVRLDEISGVDDELEEFARKHDLLTEISIDVDRWSPPLQRWAVNCMHVVLWRRRGRLVVLGSGRMLTLAKRVALYDELLPATIIEAKTLTLKQKLLVFCEEALFRPALYRTGPGYAAAALKLWSDLVAAGVQPAKDVRQFALAMGLSAATLRQHSKSADHASKRGKA